MESIHATEGHHLDFSLSPNGKTLALVDRDAHIKLWSLDGQESNTLEGHGPVWSASFSPDGKTLASADGNIIKLWSLDAQQKSHTKGHSAWVRDVSFSPDGRALAPASDDNTIKLWSLDGLELATFRGHSGNIRSVSFSPDGKTLASAGSVIILWNLDLDDLLARTCHWARDYLRNPNANFSDEDRRLCDDVRPLLQ